MWTKELVSCLEESTTERPRVDEAIAIKEQNLPKRIYKYRCDTSHSRHALKTDIVWMASPETYNDPYDSWLSFPRETLLSRLEARLVDPFVIATKTEHLISPEDVEKAKGSPRPLDSILQRVQLLKPPTAANFWGQRLESYLGELRVQAANAASQVAGFRKMMKVSSFSTVNDSLLMWSHYADHHKGFCIEYDLDSLDAQHFFRKSLYPVLYSRDFYDLRLFVEALTSGARQQFRPMLPLVAMLHKFDGWEYEREWRLISEKETVEADGPHEAPVPSSVFLGARFDPSMGKDLLNICQQKGIPAVPMHLAEDKFALFTQAAP